MSASVKRGQNTLTTSLATQYTAPGSGTNILKGVAAANTTSTAQTFDVTVNGKYVLRQEPVAANAAAIISLDVPVLASETVQAVASAGASIDLTTHIIEGIS